MHRARLRSVGPLCSVRGLGALAALAVLLLAGHARAFHVGSTFDALPGKGGGGGTFYTGAPTERGYTCAACHLNPEGKIRASLSTAPAGLFESRRYTPGQAYTVSLKLLNEHRGLSSSRSNFNGFTIVFLDGKRQHAGRISGYAADEYYGSGSALLASAGKTVGTSSWSFTWTAPPAGTGAVTMYIGMVDGNGADSPPTQTLTDPLGDDVVMASLVLSDGSTAANEDRGGASSDSPAWGRSVRQGAVWAALQVLSLGGLHEPFANASKARARRVRRGAGRRFVLRSGRRLLEREQRHRSVSRRHLHR